MKHDTPRHSSFSFPERIATHLLQHLSSSRRGGSAGGRGHRGGLGRDFRDDNPTRGRKFSSEDLQLLILALLVSKPAHGYELIKALEAHSNGYYSPSPGMIYPALTYLEEIGHVTFSLDGKRKAYELTEAGRQYLSANQQRADLMLAKLTQIARKMDVLRRVYSDDENTGGENLDDGADWLPEFIEARRALRLALLTVGAANRDEQQRITLILNHATRHILKSGK